MLKKLLTIVLPIALPFVAYWIYMILARRKALLAEQGNLPDWQKAPWGLIVISSVILMAAALIFTGLTSGVEPGTRLEPPRYVDGEVEPSRVAD